MQYQGIRLITFLCAAGMCCGALAQASSTDPNAQSSPSSTSSSTPSSSQYPSSTAPSSSTSSSTSSMNTSSTMTNNPRQVLARLDTSRKGYLSQTDVASNSYLSSHFAQCDTNGDGKLSEDELSTCIQGAPSGTSFQ